MEAEKEKAKKESTHTSRLPHSHLAAATARSNEFHGSRNLSGFNTTALPFLSVVVPPHSSHCRSKRKKQETEDGPPFFLYVLSSERKRKNFAAFFSLCAFFTLLCFVSRKEKERQQKSTGFRCGCFTVVNRKTEWEKKRKKRNIVSFFLYKHFKKNKTPELSPTTFFFFCLSVCPVH